MYKSFSKVVINLWEKSAEKKRLTFFEKILFLILCFFEKFYCIAFSINQTFRKKNGNKLVPNLKVFSVGNLSMGGTGKSVFVGFLIQFLGVERCAIISRGYGGRHRGSDSLMVSDGKTFFCTPDVCGDEPHMLAHSLHVPVFVGRDRFKSCLLLNKFLELSKRFAILDDGYQNYQLKKDFEIVLIDARSPFGNGHCFPAGNLREKDYSRADLIILTHADVVTSEEILQIKTKFLSKFDSRKILCGKHKPLGLFLFDEQQIELNDYKKKKFLILAAIGSFSGFTQSLKNFGVQIDQVLQFPDHHKYTIDDIALIFDIVKKHVLDGVITTQKDWTKLSFLIGKDEKKLMVFVFRIAFEFLTSDEELSFKNILELSNYIG